MNFLATNHDVPRYDLTVASSPVPGIAGDAGEAVGADPHPSLSSL
jgi:hypothetical protein